MNPIKQKRKLKTKTLRIRLFCGVSLIGVVMTTSIICLVFTILHGVEDIITLRMGCGSSSASAATTARKPSENKNTASKTSRTDNRQSTERNGLSHATKENKYNNNYIEKENCKSDINQDLVSPSEYQENEKTRRNPSKINDSKEMMGKLASAVAFEVKFNDNSRIRRPPKLQKLDNVTMLTAEMLAKKQAIADDNRQKEIQRKLEKTSKRKKKLLKAREMDRAQERLIELEEKMNAQKEKRAKLQAGIISKQQIREQHAKQVRARAEKIREEGDTVEFDVDADDTYNADEEDQTWDMERKENHSTNNSQSNITTPQLEEQEELKTKQTPDNIEHSVHDFFEE